MAKTMRVSVLAFDGCFAAVLFGLVDVLNLANEVSASLRPGTPPPFRVRVVSVDGRRVTLADGTQVRAEVATADTDQVVVPGWVLVDQADLDERLQGLRREVAWLSSLRRRRTGVASLCLGAALVAEAGLLDGHTVTTSWFFAPELARRHPLVDVRASAVVLRDGRILSAAAFSAYQDLALLLVEEQAGADVARATGRLTLIPQVRPSQDPWVEVKPVRQAGFADDVKRWLRAHLADPYDLERLADELGVSSRTLLRRFGEEAGQSPLTWLQAARVTAAKRLLESSDLSVGEVTRQVGYTDLATFRSLFRAQTGLAPAEWRRQLGARPLAGSPR